MIRNEEAVLQVRDLLLRYGEGCEYCQGQNRLEKNRCPHCGTVWAIRDVSFDVYPGEVLGIVGESGSGKSSVMKSLYFDHQVTGGSAYLQQYQQGAANIFAASSSSVVTSRIILWVWSIKIHFWGCVWIILRQLTWPKRSSLPVIAMWHLWMAGQ